MGERKSNDDENSLQLWLKTNMPKAGKKNGDTCDDTNLEEMAICSVCEKEMNTTNPSIITYQRCQQWIEECLKPIGQKQDKEQIHGKVNMTRNQTDDETEFHRIPIAGENESDYGDSDEYEEEEDSILPYLEGEDNDDSNSTDTDDSEFQNVPIVIVLSEPAQENNGKEIEQTDTDTDDDSIGETIAAMFNEKTDEQQQNISSATPPSIFTTPDNRNTKSILELLRQATQNRTQLITFDASTAFIQGQTPSVSLQKSDDIAFLVGPRRDGIIKMHQLSPIYSTTRQHIPTPLHQR
jgi:hypothetical protein